MTGPDTHRFVGKHLRCWLRIFVAHFWIFLCTSPCPGSQDLPGYNIKKNLKHPVTTSDKDLPEPAEQIKSGRFGKLLAAKIPYNVLNRNALFNLMIVANSKGLIDFNKKSTWSLMISLAKYTGLNCHQSSILGFLSLNPDGFFNALERENEDEITGMYADELKKYVLKFYVSQFETGRWDVINLDLHDFEAADLIMDYIIYSILFPGLCQASETESISFILGTCHSFLVMSNPEKKEELVYENCGGVPAFHQSSVKQIRSRYISLILKAEEGLYAKMFTSFRNAVPLPDKNLQKAIDRYEHPRKKNRMQFIRQYSDKLINIHLSK